MGNVLKGAHTANLELQSLCEQNMKHCREWASGQTLCQGQADDCLGNTHLFHIKDKTPGCDSGGSFSRYS